MCRSEPQTPVARDADDGVVGGEELGLGLVLDADVVRSVEGDRLHRARDAIAPGPCARLPRDDAELAERVRAMPWYHTIDLGDGLVTQGYVDTRPCVDKLPWPDAGTASAAST